MFRIARIGLHHFEEPCISGERGSGTIFFSGCNLKCLFCQNYEISHQNKGLDVTDEQLIKGINYLVELGAENINLVTPSNYTSSLAPLLKKIKPTLPIPIVWNSSGYESVNNLKKMEGLVDIYLPDFKYSDDSLAFEYSHAKNYFEIAQAALTEMRRQCPDDIFDDDGMMKDGVIVRHLVLPDALENTRGALNAIADIDYTMYVSLMCQYFPTAGVKGHSKLDRRLTQDEYDKATEYFFNAGLKNGFSQELESAKEEYVPSFDIDKLKKII
ncbi:MAG: 4Fe-4S cluster-binding domain-containing protein [Clostridia bacterium]